MKGDFFMSILDSFLLTGKKAVVTGGARGIGATCAFALAEAGADVFIMDVLDGSEIVQRIRALGREAHALRVDVTSEEQVERAFEQVLGAFGTVDLLFNNAGIAHCVPAEACSFADWRRVVSIDFDAVFLVARTAGRIMIKNGGGAIVNTASQWGLHPAPNHIAYNVTKAAVVSLSQTLHAELAPFGIGVTVVCPPVVKTNILDNTLQAAGGGLDFDIDAEMLLISTAMQNARITPEEVARRAVRAVERNRLYVVPGAGNYITWLNSRLAPGLLYHSLALLHKRGWDQPLFMFFAKRGLM